MNTPGNITLLNKDGQRSCIVKKISDTDYELLITSAHCAYNLYDIDEPEDGFKSLDMIGGPLIEVGQTLQAYDPALPNKKIVKIACDKHGTTLILED